MKYISFIYALILVWVFTSCDAKDNPNALLDTQFASEINDSAHILSPKTYSYLKNIIPPLGIKPVIVAVEKIEDAEMGTFADDLFDEYCKKKYSGNTFKNRGILIVASKNPELVQVRVGKTYDAFCRMRGSAAGADYLNMQRETAIQGVNEMCPVALNNVLRDIEECRQFPWYKKLALKMSFYFISIEVYLDDIATTSKSFFGQFYFRPFLYIVGVVKSILGDWIFAFLFISIFYIVTKGWVEGKLNAYYNHKIKEISEKDDDVRKIKRDFYNGFKWLSMFILKLFITIPTLTAISVLSTSRMEDIIELKYAHIPFVNIIESATNWSNGIPELWLGMLLMMIYYLKFLFCWKGYFTYGHMSDKNQKELYGIENIRKEFDLRIKIGCNRKGISWLCGRFFENLLQASIHQNHHEIENENNPHNTEEKDNSKKKLIDFFFLDAEAPLYKQSPVTAIQMNLHREALFLTFFVGLVTSVILSYTYTVYFLILWTVQLIYRIIMEIVFVRKNFSNRLQGFSPFRLIKKVWIIDLVFFIIMGGLFLVLTPSYTPKTTEVITEVKQSLPDDLTGLYFVSKVDGVSVKGVTARIVQDQYGNYFMQVYSDQPMRRFALQLDEENGVFHCDILGDGYITYDKQAKSININFSDLWILTN